MKLNSIRFAALLSGLLIATSAARADLAPTPAGSPLFLIGAAAVLVIVLWLLIRGALSLPDSSNDTDDGAGVGTLEGIDEDDDERKKRK
jgi:hypothetical protein